MKFVCGRCGNLVDEEDIMIKIVDVNGYRLSIEAYCPSCWEGKKGREKKVSEDSFWRRIKK